MKNVAGSFRPAEPTARSDTGTGSASQLDVLTDRFSSSGQVVVIRGDNQTPNSLAFTDQELNSVQTFYGVNNDQCRLRGALSLMLRLTAGDSTTQSSNSISIGERDVFSTLPSLHDFWPLLSTALKALESLSDPFAVLLLQPSVESFCLAHLFSFKDNILIRQRTTNQRFARAAAAAASASPGTMSLINMVPSLQLRVDPSLATTAAGGAREPVSSVGHINLDVVGPVSPPSLPTEDETGINAVGMTTETSSHQGTSSVASVNPILRFAEQHRTALNQILRHHGNKMSESPFTVFLLHPRILDFDIKRQFFRQQLQMIASRTSFSRRFEEEQIVVSRDRIFEDSYARLHRKTPEEWKHKFVIRFQSEYRI